jgi:hypothetical protein
MIRKQQDEDKQPFKLMNIHFAMSDYGRIKHLLRLNEVFKKEKTL